MEVDKRFEAIETKCAYQEIDIAELKGIVMEQGKKIDLIEKKLAKATLRLKEFGEIVGGDPLPKNERPPHY